MTREYEFTCKLRIIARNEEEALETIRDYFREFGSLEDDEPSNDQVLEATVDLNPVA